MSKPRDTLWPLEDHSRGKHAILRRYVQAWLPIMATQSDRLVLVDGFAGPGRYRGGEPGSPLIMLDAYLRHSHREGIRAELTFLFIEERQDRVDHLTQEVSALGPLPKNVHVQIEHGSYQDLFRQLLAELQAAQQTLAPTFSFIDPFGYSDAPMDQTGQFFQFRKCEALVYVPTDAVVRFLTVPGQEQALTTLYGTDEWKKGGAMPGSERRQFLHDLFRDQLQKHGSRWVRSFEIVKGSGLGYYLFFGTNSPAGMEKMKDAMWSVDRQTGCQYRDATDSALQPVLFESHPNTGPLLTSLRQHFGTRQFTIEEAERYTILETAYAKSHLRRLTLVPEEKSGRLEVHTQRARRFCYPVRTKMSFS